MTDQNETAVRSEANPVLVGDFVTYLNPNLGQEASEVVYVSPNQVVYVENNGLKVRHLSAYMGDRGLMRVATTDDLGWMTVHTQDQLPKSKYGDTSTIAEALVNSLDSYYFEPSTFHSHVLTNLDFGSATDVSNKFKLHKVSLGEGSSIVLYKDAKDLKRERTTTMKVGRALRHMFPDMDDKKLAKIAEGWIEQTAPRNLTLKVGKERANFRKAYKGIRASYRNPTTTHTRKSLSTSCMHTVEVEGYSPAEAFASGDFAIAWIETSEGHVAGRVVYSDQEGLDHYHAPLYGACEQSLDMLKAHLDSIESEEANGCDWYGLRMLNLTSCLDNPIAPYLDVDLAGDIDSEFITFSRGGDATFESTDGYITGGHYCECCGDRVYEEESYWTEDGTMCQSCFHEGYVSLDCGESIRRDDAIEVRYSYRSFTTNDVYYATEFHHYNFTDSVYCEVVDEYWHVDDVVETKDGEYLPTHRIGDFPELFNDDEEDNDNDKDQAT